MGTARKYGLAIVVLLSMFFIAVLPDFIVNIFSIGILSGFEFLLTGLICLLVGVLIKG